MISSAPAWAKGSSKICGREHQVDIKKHFGQRPDETDDSWSKGNIGDKMAVHDVEVQPLRAGTVGPFDFPAKTGVVGGEQRWRDNHALSLSK